MRPTLKQSCSRVPASPALRLWQYCLLAGLSLGLGACVEEERQPPRRARVPVTSEVLEPGPFQPGLPLLGKVEPATRVELRSPAAGRIRYPTRFAGGLRTGEAVRRGELLFEIDSDDARLRLAEAEIAQRLAEAALDRAQRGVEGGFLAAAELESRQIEAELAKERLASARTHRDRLHLRSPSAGVLQVDRVLAPGSEVSAAAVVAELAGDGAPRIDAWAAAADRERLRAGLEVEILAPGTSKVIGRGEVAEMAGQVDRAGTLRLVITVLEDAGLPLPGEGVDLRLLLESRALAITVPREALVVDGGISSVFVLEPEGDRYRARRRLVVAGSWSDGRVEILDGLNGGERVAVRGAELLADGLPAVEAKRKKKAGDS